MFYHIYDNFTKNEIMWLSLIIIFICEIPLIFFTYLDILKFKSLEKYRINYKKERKYPSNTDIIKAIKMNIISVFGIILPLSIFGIAFINKYELYPYNMSREMPDMLTCILHIIAILILSEVLFYTCHRIIHFSYLYNNIHRIHHLHTETFALVAHIIHPIELIIFTTVILIPPILLKSHIMIMWLCTIIINWNGLIIHSGYDFTYKKTIPYILEHDAHHEFVKYNYGVMFSFMDKLCGTYYLPK
tara:strand:- start:26 stop:760 length:735 start_codon:yes stop_codon:yes gene_type:complete